MPKARPAAWSEGLAGLIDAPDKVLWLPYQQEHENSTKRADAQTLSEYLEAPSSIDH